MQKRTLVLAILMVAGTIATPAAVAEELEPDAPDVDASLLIDYDDEEVVVQGKLLGIGVCWSIGTEGGVWTCDEAPE